MTVCTKMDAFWLDIHLVIILLVCCINTAFLLVLLFMMMGKDMTNHDKTDPEEVQQQTIVNAIRKGVDSDTRGISDELLFRLQSLETDNINLRKELGHAKRKEAEAFHVASYHH